jgi:hypothetical protein
MWPGMLTCDFARPTHMKIAFPVWNPATIPVAVSMACLLLMTPSAAQSDIESLKERFNRDADRTRIVALLSPT